jgi:hypothetical protein
MIRDSCKIMAAYVFVEYEYGQSLSESRQIEGRLFTKRPAKYFSAGLYIFDMLHCTGYKP